MWTNQLLQILVYKNNYNSEVEVATNFKPWSKTFTVMPTFNSLSNA